MSVEMSKGPEYLMACSVQAMPFGATVLPNGDGVRFQMWAPTANTVELCVGEQHFPLEKSKDGWYSTTLPQAAPGTLYHYRINNELNIPDPASRAQPQDVHGPSEVVDPASFLWRDTDWKGLPWEETVLYELHVGTFTPEGTFKGVEKKLDYLRDLGITAIELMPLSEFPGSRNWGYDGVLHFAPERSYGKPDDLKSLIQAAHEKGIQVFLDVVYNHFGPEGNYLHAYAESFFTEKYHTPWGAALDFESAATVRDFFIFNALFWLNEYHFDGLRFDAVHAIQDASEPHFLMEMAERIRAGVAPGRQIHLVLENDNNSARFLKNSQCNAYEAQWNDDFHHAAHVLLTGEFGGYYSDYAAESSAKPPIAHLARCLTEGFAYQGERSPYRANEQRGEKSDHLPLIDFVDFLQNHDQIGNRAFGDRLSSLSESHAMKTALATLILSPSIPLLFMGEEWQSKTPFRFFCDFGPDLAPLVTEGRRKEFAQFSEFSNPKNRERIPDPCTPQTFQDSFLDWEALETQDGQAWLAFCKQLLTLRRTEIVPLLRSGAISSSAASPNMKPGYNLLGSTGALVWWPFSEQGTLFMSMNLGASALTFTLPEFHNRRRLGEARLLFESEGLVFDSLLAGRLPAWSVVCLRLP
jgi:maltooligosyltrehalose trehalohydrolase